MTRVQWTGGTEHWTHKGDIRLFLWNKPAHAHAPKVGTILFVHGSSMASQPTFDLSVPGRPHSSVMDWFAERGFDTWCMDNEGYGRKPGFGDNAPRGFAPRGDMGAPRGADRGDFAPRKPAFAKPAGGKPFAPHDARKRPARPAR